VSELLHEPASVTAMALDRTAMDAPPAPIRIVHLGLGAFHRAHQAWYTARAADASSWGIAAFTGRDPGLAERLTAQDGLYTLIERSADGDRAEVVTSLVETHAGTDVARLAELLASPDVAIVTLTITEAGYRLNADGAPDLDDPIVAADLELLRAEVDGGASLEAAAAHTPGGHTPGFSGPPLRSAPARLLFGLDVRRLAGGAPIAIVPCDNLPHNGQRTRRGLLQLAALVSAPLHDWIADSVSFVDTSVDRITPRADGSEFELARAAGWVDAAPVVTEPFRDWVLSGDFPAGRPAWETAGARFVDDIEPWEFRKLWLLNGAHSILAYAGSLRGHRTVADAIADPVCRELVDAFHAEAAAVLPAGVEHVEYRQALIARFENPAIEHRLVQIAADGADKVRYRFAPVAERVLAADGEASHSSDLDAGEAGTAGASAAALATWIAWVLAADAATELPAPDVRAAEVRAAAVTGDPVEALVRLVSAPLADHTGFLAEVRSRVAAHGVANASARPDASARPEASAQDEPSARPTELVT
jgi:fructuronate reductase